MVLTILGVLQGCLLQPVLAIDAEGENAATAPVDTTQIQKEVSDYMTAERKESDEPSAPRSLFGFFMEAELATPQGDTIWHRSNPNRFLSANADLRRLLRLTPGLIQALGLLSGPIASSDPSSLATLQGQLKVLLQRTSPEAVATKLRSYNVREPKADDPALTLERLKVLLLTGRRRVNLGGRFLTGRWTGVTTARC